MPKIIVNGSQMKCSLGTAPSQIKVTSQNFSKICSRLIATEADKEGITNIPSFGACRRSSPPPSCVPSPVKWENTTIKDNIVSNKKLTLKSFCMCSFGGKIELIDSGDNVFVDGE